MLHVRRPLAPTLSSLKTFKHERKHALNVWLYVSDSTVIVRKWQWKQWRFSRTSLVPTMDRLFNCEYETVLENETDYDTFTYSQFSLMSYSNRPIYWTSISRERINAQVYVWVRECVMVVNGVYVLRQPIGAKSKTNLIISHPKTLLIKQWY